MQFVGLIVKLGLSMLTWIERIRIGMPPMIEGTVSESADDLGVSGSTWSATRTTTDSVVVGAGERRGDRDQAESGAPLNGPARYIFPTAWNGWVPGPGGDVAWCRSELEAGQLGVGLLGAAELLRRRRRSPAPGSRRSRAGCR